MCGLRDQNRRPGAPFDRVFGGTQQRLQLRRRGKNVLIPFKAAEESDDLRVIRRAEHQQEAVVLPGRLARRAA